ncbi:cytochrome b561 and DOMON domain-containing protein At5g47530-like [Lotus japonicus]|uniref:cytochrome b561 and DOMON domain-containing protein At5g47530-like n=1 Tax=Lotus japonicus TaxID=34305 RepID=UPI00258B311C|nr:cytochrome b561 and DOMON domain-containing protein At5g47530-like [Lotus japonicus]
MASNMLVLFVSFSSLLLTSSAQTCNEHTFPNNKVFSNCTDLPQLSSFFHWTYEQATGKLDLAFRHAQIPLTNRWVAWAISPNTLGNLKNYMVGAQALVAIIDSNGATKAYTSSISNYRTVLEKGEISYPNTGLMATYKNNEVTIFATLTLPNHIGSIVHLWQDGPLSGPVPQVHSLDAPHINSKQFLHLV